MSQENVEIVRRGMEAYAARRDLDATLADSHPEVVWCPVEERAIQGFAAIRSYLSRWEELWDDYEIRAEDYIRAGDHVLVTMHFRGRGRASSVEAKARSYQVYTLRDGKIVGMVEFLDRAKALEAVGLSE